MNKHKLRSEDKGAEIDELQGIEAVQADIVAALEKKRAHRMPYVIIPESGSDLDI